MKKFARARGITRVELFMVLACFIILGCLWSMITGTQKRGPARRTMCLNNIRQLVLACHNYQSANQIFPTGSSAPTDGFGESLFVSLLPYVDHSNAYESHVSNLESMTFNESLELLSKLKIECFICCDSKSDEQFATDVSDQFAFHYLPCMGPNRDPGSIGYQFSNTTGPPPIGNSTIGLNGIFSPHSLDPSNPTVRATFDKKFGKSFNDVIDGSSNTISFFESSRNFSSKSGTFDLRKGWAFGHSETPDGANIEYVFSGSSIDHSINSIGSGKPHWNARPPGSNHPGGTLIALVDGSARFVSETIDIEVLRALAGINDEEGVTFD